MVAGDNNSNVLNGACPHIGRLGGAVMSVSRVARLLVVDGHRGVKTQGSRLAALGSQQEGGELLAAAPIALADRHQHHVEACMGYW